jgi:hypothetical protein
LAPWRHLHLQSGPSVRRFAARASLPSGQCAAKTVMTTRCPLSAGLPEAGPDLARTPSVGLDQGAVPQATIAGAGGRLGRVASGQTVDEEPGVHIRHQRPVLDGQHHSTRLSSASSASASGQGGRPRRPVRDLDLGAHRPGAACVDAQGGESPMPGLGSPVVPHDGGRNVAEPSADDAGQRPSGGKQ